MDKQPEALRLAETLENLEATGWGGDCFALTDWSEKQAELASAELRRLHSQNQELRESVKKANAQAEHFERLWYLRGDVNQELIEVLEEFIRNPAGDNTEENAIAILTKHKEQA